MKTKGQIEAAKSLALPKLLIMRKVVLPQALGYLIPPTTNMSMTLVKESSVLSVITVAELTYASQFVIGKYFAPVEMFSVVAILYWALNALLSWGLGALEWRATRFARLGRTSI